MRELTFFKMATADTEMDFEDGLEGPPPWFYYRAPGAEACGQFPVMDRDAVAVVREAAEREIAEGAAFHARGGMPLRWLGPVVRYRCERGHVLPNYLKSRFLKRAACLQVNCLARVWVTFPEDG